MGLLNRIFGMEATPMGSAHRSNAAAGTEAYALDRYRYMLQTAPPETIEQAHAEAFEKLTPEQRREVLSELAASAPIGERGAIGRVSADDTQAVARAATRAEIRQPGIMERTLGGSSGSGFGAGLLGSFAAGVAGSVVANSFFSALSGFDGFGGEGSEGANADLYGPDGPDVAEDEGSLAGVGDLDGDLDSAAGFDGSDLDL